MVGSGTTLVGVAGGDSISVSVTGVLVRKDGITGREDVPDRLRGASVLSNDSDSNRGAVTGGVWWWWWYRW